LRRTNERQRFSKALHRYHCRCAFAIPFTSALALILAHRKGTSLEGSSLLSHLPVRVVATTSGSVSVATDGSTIAFVRRHHAAHSDGGSSAGSGLAANEYQHPDKINYAAIASALHSLGVTHVIAACSVGSLKPILSVGSLLVPSDYFAPWCCVSVHADKRAHIVPQLDPYLRALLLDAARESKASVAVDGGVYVQTQGPRFETKAEISFLQGVGDVVGMTGAVEAAMMQEVGLPYAMICCVDNMANGITCPSTAAATPLTLSSFTASAAANRPSIELVMSRAIALLSSPTLPSPAQSSPLLAACDIMIHCGIVLPVVPHRTELRAHSIIIRGNAIADLLPTPDALARYSAVSVSDMKSHIVMPGLVNLHTHAAMKLMKGVGSDVELMPWLQQCASSPPVFTQIPCSKSFCFRFIWPLEAKLVCHDYVYDGTRLALAEMLLGGTTCINDMCAAPVSRDFVTKPSSHATLSQSPQTSLQVLLPAGVLRCRHVCRCPRR
jgi:purine nucleoside phosphorylase